MYSRYAFVSHGSQKRQMVSQDGELVQYVLDGGIFVMEREQATKQISIIIACLDVGMYQRTRLRLSSLVLD
jgi:hypothetical protein